MCVFFSAILQWSVQSKSQKVKVWIDGNVLDFRSPEFIKELVVRFEIRLVLISN